MDIIQRRRFLRKCEEMGFTAQIRRFFYDRKQFYLVTGRERDSECEVQNI